MSQGFPQQVLKVLYMGIDSILLTRTVYPDFVHRFIIIKPKEVHAVAPDLKAGTKIILESVEAMNDKWRLGHTKVFFRAGGEIRCHGQPNGEEK